MDKKKRTQSNKVRFADMEERGWNRELCRIYLPDRSGWFDLKEAEAAEATPEWQRDYARAAKRIPLLMTREDLDWRKWTPAMIKQFLGDPPIVIKLNSSGTRVYHQFKSIDVEAVEATQEFADRLKEAQRRSAIATEAAYRVDEV